jgi:hypothetical protein
MSRSVVSSAPFRAWLSLFCICLAAGFASRLVAPVANAAPPTVQELVSQFDPENYLNIVSNKLYTREGMNRAPLQVGGLQHDLCRDAIYDELTAVGLSPYRDFFDYVDTTNLTRVYVCNVVAVKEGVQNPNNEIWVVGAHYDSRENPGADDNATGVGCQLEMARIFSQYHFAKTIVFAFFDSEERWEYLTGKHRLGSLRYVDQHKNDNIKGMVSVDMIGWQAPPPNNNRAAIRGRSSFNALCTDLQAALNTHGNGLIGVISTSENMSDHYSFAQAGIPACCLIEYNYSANPRYHRPGDFVEAPNYLDWSYLERMCKGAIGFFAEKIQPVDVTPRVVSIQVSTNGTPLIHFTGLPRCQYAIEVATNLNAPVWVALATNTASATDGAFVFYDAEAGTRPEGFYRARFVAGYVGGGGVAPQITTQPLHRTVDTGQPTQFTATATGDAPLIYQWRLNGAAIPGATDNTYVIAGAQATDAGDYALVVENFSGAVTSRVVSLTVYPPQTVVFADDFDTDTAAQWTLNRSSVANTRVTFNYDYAADGIPAAPNSVGGTTRAVKFEANMTGSTTAALSLSPVGQSFSGDYRLRFDMWMNANGPFPGGGTGSTEYLTAGLGTAGNRVQWTGSGSTADGYWFVVSGEGGASDTSAPADYGAYSGTGIQSAASGVYASGTDSNARGNVNPYYTTAFPGGQTPPPLQQANYPTKQTGALAAGTVGFAWRDVVIAKRGNIVEWSIDGVKLASFTSASVTASNVFVGYWDPYISVSDTPELSFGLVDNVRVEVSTNTAPPADIILDNPSAPVVGDWTTGTSSTDKFGSDYYFTSTKGTGSAYIEFRPNLQASGNYNVYEWHPQGTNRTTDAPVEITFNGGTQTVTVNQQINGGTWVLLGTFNFSAGTTGYVRIKDNFTTGSVVLADAVKFVYVP